MSENRACREADTDRASGAHARATRGTIGRDSLRILISQVAGNAGYFAGVVVLARALGPTDRGTVAFITVTALVASQLAMIGISDATRVLAARSPTLRPALLANVTLVALVVAAVVGICIAAVLELIPGLRPASLGSRELAILVFATTAVASVGAGFAFLQGCGRFGPYSRVQASAPWLYTAALAVVDATVGLTVARAAIIWMAAQGLSGLRLLWAGASGTGWARPHLGILRESLRFGARAWIGSTSRTLNARTDQIITGIISTEATLGIYAVAVNASEILYYLPVAASDALLPAVAAGDESTRVERILRVYRAVLLITIVGMVFAAALGPLLLPLVFGSAYRPAIGPFLILVPSGIGFATMSVFSGGALGSLEPGRSSLGPAAALISQTGLDLILIPRAGATGAALAASAALLIAGAVAVAAYRARFPFAWRLLLPRLRDLGTIGQFLRGVLRPPAVTPS